MVVAVSVTVYVAETSLTTIDLNFDSTGDTLQASSCTNSLLTQDKSAYWAPWMYFQHENSSFEDVKLALGLTA